MILRHRYFLFLLLLLSNGSSSFAQLPQHRLQQIQEQDGLKTGDIISMARDRNGYLWICTQTHAQRFDGRQTLRFPFEETILKVMIDADDVAWVTTRYKIYRFDKQRQAFQEMPLSNGTAALGYFFQLDNGEMIALADEKQYRFDKKHQRFEEVGSGPLSAPKFYGATGNYLVFANGDSVFAFDQQFQKRLSFRIGNYYGIFPLDENNLLISALSYELFVLHLPTGKRHHVKTPKDFENGHIIVHRALTLANNEWIIGTTEGCFVLTIPSFNITPLVFYRNGIPQVPLPPITAWCRDENGDVFIKNGDGLFFWQPNGKFISYLRSHQPGNNGLPANNVRSFTEDEKGNVWMATINGICYLEPQDGRVQNIPLKVDNSLQDPSCRQVFYLNGKIWVGTQDNGVFCYDARQGIQRPHLLDASKKQDSIFHSQYVWKLLGLHGGNLLAFTNTGQYLISPKTMEARWLFDNKGLINSRTGMQDAAGRIWHGTTDGLSCYDSLFRQLFHVKDSFLDKRIASFYEWKPDRVLVGSKGLYELTVSENKLTTFTAKQGIPATTFIYCMAKDDEGMMWLGTDDGIYRYDPLNDRAIFFDASEGVQTGAFNSDGAFLSSNGTMFMGGRYGINYFKPSAFQKKGPAIQPKFQFARVGDSLLSTANASSKFAYINSTLDFLISAPEFLRPFSLGYRYRLSANDEWIDNGTNNRVRISRLPPGKYHLQIAASSDGVKWITSADSISFTIKQPWWQTIWFRLACAGVTAIIIWQVLAFRKRRRKNLEQQRTIEYFTYATTNNTVDNIVWDIARNCIAHLGFQDSVIYLLDEQRNVLVQKAALGPKSKPPFVIVNPLEIPVGQGITGASALTGKTISVPDTSKDTRYIVDDELRMSELAVPILFHGKTIGVIDSEHKQKNFFTKHHQKMLETIASLCADKIVTAQASERVKLAEMELHALNAEMREASFTNLRLQMNPHFLFNTLTTIQYLIVSGQVQKASSYLDIFSGFLRSLLNHAEDTIVSLNEELRILKLYVQLESICLDETFLWTVDIEPTIDSENVLVPFMLLQPFIENTIHHGLLHKVGDKKFFISISQHDEDTLKCVIEDNGVGRDASSAINEKKIRRHMHPSKGLIIVKQRLQLLQQKTGRQAGFETEDLFTNGLATGTRIHLLIPDYQTEEV